MKEEMPGKSFPHGSPEDIKLTLKNLQLFFASKLEAIDAGDRWADNSGSTRSICHIDGVTDDQ